MERCFSHNRPITEFDHYVYDRVFPQRAGHCYECFECLFDKNEAFEKKKRHDNGVTLGIQFIISIIISASLYLWAINIDNTFLIILGYAFLLIDYFSYGIKLITNMHLPTRKYYDPAETRYEFKTDYKGDIYAEEHHIKESSGETPMFLLCIFLFFTMFLWVIPYTIILALIKKSILRHNVPKQVLDAYDEAKRCVPQYNILQSKENRKSYLNHFSNIDKFYKKASKIESKYSSLGRDMVWNEILHLDFPAWKLTLNNQTYVVIDYTKDNKKRFDEPIYLIGKNSNNQYIAGAIVNGYLTPMEVISDLKEWISENYFSDNTIKYLKLYQKQKL